MNKSPSSDKRNPTFVGYCATVGDNHTESRPALSIINARHLLVIEQTMRTVGKVMRMIWS